MQLIRDVKAISKIILILLLLISFIVGALLSYVWTMGYYAPFEFHLPTKPNVTIEAVEFDAQNASFFNVRLLNPSYAVSSIQVTKIAARTTDDNRLHEINVSDPALPFVLEPGVSQTFKCLWNWANYTGITLPYADQPVEILVFIRDGSGATFEIKRPLVTLLISEITFNSNISLTQFNVTVQNVAASVTYVNITSITVNMTTATLSTTPSLPVGLAPGESPKMFTVSWNWTAYQGRSVTVAVHTLQGYFNQRTVVAQP